MFLLPDGRKITKDQAEELLDALLDDEKYETFFDLKNLEVVSISTAHKRKLACYREDASVFLPVPQIGDETLKEWMQDYVTNVATAFTEPEMLSAHRWLL